MDGTVNTIPELDILADPLPHIGKCYRQTGPELLSPHDIAEILTGVVGRTVTYQKVTLKMFLKAATAQGVPPFDMASIRLYVQDLSGGDLRELSTYDDSKVRRPSPVSISCSLRKRASPRTKSIAFFRRSRAP